MTIVVSEINVNTTVITVKPVKNKEDIVVPEAEEEENKAQLEDTVFSEVTHVWEISISFMLI